jgi:hypothetical protein
MASLALREGIIFATSRHKGRQQPFHSDAGPRKAARKIGWSKS